jgi:hypothetical protein
VLVSAPSDSCSNLAVGLPSTRTALCYLNQTPSVAEHKRLQNCCWTTYCGTIAILVGPFTQHTAPHCTCSAHAGFYVIDFFGLSFLSIMGAQQNLCAENLCFHGNQAYFSRFTAYIVHTNWVTAHVCYSSSPPHFSIGKAVNIRDREFDYQ